MKRTHAGAAIRKGSRAGSKIIAAAMKAAAPVRTGALKASIKVRALPRKKGSTGTRVVETAYYAGFVEFGTKRMKGKHSVEKAADGAKDEAISTFIDTMKAEIKARMK